MTILSAKDIIPSRKNKAIALLKKFLVDLGYIILFILLMIATIGIASIYETRIYNQNL